VPSIDVVIVAFNRWELTERCLRHVQEQTTPHAVIVVDNGSEDDTAQNVRALCPQAQVIRLETNTGFPAACNSGVALGTGEIIVLLNNDGGGIFHFLPVAREGDAFEEHVATPHGLDFAHAAALYGCGYEQPEDAASLNAAVAASIERAGTTIIEVKTDRQANLALHRRMAEAALAALRRSDLDL
jgi:glycosyltransferase involved in cell wall biosynthesis